MLDDPLGDLVLVEFRAVGVDAARGAGEGTGDGRRVRGPLTRRDPRAQSRGGHGDPDAVAPAQVPRRHRGDLLDDEIEGRPSLVAGPELDGGVDHQPHDVALLPLHLAHQQASSPRARLPGDPLEGITGHVVSQLPELVAFARDVRGPPHLGAASRAPTPRGGDHRGERHGQDLDPDGVGKEQGDLVEALAAERRTPDLEGEAVHAPAADAKRRDRDVDACARTGRQIERRRLDLHPQHARRQRPDRHATHRLGPAVAELGFEDHRPAAGGPVHARRPRPDHLEARRAQSCHRDQGDRPPHGHRQQHRRTEGDHGRQARRRPEGDQARPRHRHVERHPGRVKLHRGENTWMAPLRTRARVDAARFTAKTRSNTSPALNDSSRRAPLRYGKPGTHVLPCFEVSSCSTRKLSSRRASW